MSACDAPEDLHATAQCCAALGHVRRLEILLCLSARGACSCKDVVAEVDLAQSTISQHLKQLVEAGLVRFTASGQRSRYEVDEAALSAVLANLSALSARMRKDT